MSSRRHSCGCATAKAPGREPGPCCWPLRGGQTGGMILLSPQGTTVRNYAEVCQGAKAPRTAIEFVELVDKRGIADVQRVFGYSRRAPRTCSYWPAERSPRG